jgi:hypothetical protein
MCLCKHVILTATAHNDRTAAVRCLLTNELLTHRLTDRLGVGVLLAADSQSTSSSGYRASLWDP